MIFPGLVISDRLFPGKQERKQDEYRQRVNTLMHRNLVVSPETLKMLDANESIDKMGRALCFSSNQLRLNLAPTGLTEFISPVPPYVSQNPRVLHKRISNLPKRP
jgi:hypothetical protein